MSIRQFAIPVFIAFLVVLVAVMGRTLWVDLANLSTAGNENAQWTILQLDTEFANLQSTLFDQGWRGEFDRDEIRLRTDITISRINIVGRGVSAEIIEGDDRARALLVQLQDFADEAAAIVDGDLGPADIDRLTQLAAATSPLARQFSLRGVQIGAERTEARRHEFATKLRNTGLVAIGVIAVLAGVLVFLNRLLWIARQKDRALSASSKRLESTIHGSLDAMITSDGKGEILDFNPAAELIFDWKKDELTGLNVGILLADWACQPDASKVGQTGNAFSEYLDQGRVEITARRRTGEVFPADLNVTSAGEASDGLVIVYLRDISDQKVNEQALVDAKKRAERTERAKSRFLTIMSHEMRTPLNGVLGVLDLLKTTKLNNRQSQYLDVATASSEALMRQLNEALDVTRIETGSLVLAPQRFNFAEEVSRIASVLEPLATEKGIELTLEIDPEMRMDFVADGNRIGQIVTNLIGNAIKFTDAGSVSVNLTGIHTLSETLASIAVKDTGFGIPEEYLEAVFEEFVVLSHSSGRMSRSDGLGLSISRKTARIMGGDIKVSSVEGSGSAFTLTLPLERAQGSAHPFKEQSELAETSGNKPTALSILVIEDNRINRTVLREMLEDMGHAVGVARDGMEGYQIAMRSEYDLILMDIDLPKIDGIELTKKLREHDGPNRNTRIHGLTAYGKEEYLDRAKDAGMNGFSTKPIRLRHLDRIMRDEEPSGVERAGEPEDQVIDLVVFEELRAALGETRLRNSTDAFFCETEQVLANWRQLDLQKDREAFVSQLHNLSGAAALFGLQAMAEKAASARAKTEQYGDIVNLNAMLHEIEELLSAARCHVSELTNSEMRTAENSVE